MTRSAAVTGLVLIALGAALFGWKTLALDLPLVPSNPEGLWQVEIEVAVRGQGRGSVRAALPESGPGQVVFDEHAVSDRLLFSVRSERGERLGVWSGRFQGVHTLAYSLRVQLSEVVTPLPGGPGADVPDEIANRHLGASGNFPVDAPEVEETLASLRLPEADDPAGRLRSIYSFVTDEVASVPGAGSDPLLTLAQREGSALGVERLLVTLLRAAGIPARPVRGLELREGSYPSERAWAEAWLDGTWVPLSASEGFFARRPRHLLAIRAGEGPLVEATGVEATAHRTHVLRERLRPDELAAMLVPANPTLARLSLYRLPVPLQATLRLLLLLPLGALITAVYRNVIGIPTFGTFMPALLALALRTSTLQGGLALIGVVLAIGIGGRLLLDRLRLLLVPRLSVLLCVVVLAVTGLALVARGTGARDLFAGLLLPIVILTMLIERFSITIAEEGLRQALVRAGWSLVVAVSIYPVFRSAWAEHMMFGYPELVVVVMGLLVLVGGYTGYRLTDWLRFRLLTAPQAEELR